MSLADWTSQWWAWSNRLGPVNNPFTDTTGALAKQGNNGPVFFIAGSFQSSRDVNGQTIFSADRSFSVPMGKPLLMPLINSNLCIPTVGGVTVEAAETQIDDLLKTNCSHVTDVFLKVDGTMILDENPMSFIDYESSRGYVESPFMSQGKRLPHSQDTLGRANLGWTDLADSVAPDRTLFKNADLFPAEAAGWWALVSDLSPGTHTIEFGGTATGFAGANGEFIPTGSSWT